MAEARPVRVEVMDLEAEGSGAARVVDHGGAAVPIAFEDEVAEFAPRPGGSAGFAAPGVVFAGAAAWFADSAGFGARLLHGPSSSSSPRYSVAAAVMMSVTAGRSVCGNSIITPQRTLMSGNVRHMLVM
jgi:hypothetical protein